MIPIRHFMTLCEVELPEAIFTEAAKRLIDNIDWGGGDRDTALHMMGYDEEGQEELDTDSPEFQAQLMRWAEERVSDVYFDIDEHFQGDVLRVYRMITAPSDWTPDPARHPGEYWSWNERAAEAHWGDFRHFHVKWLLTADVHSSQIDWPQTLAANGSPSLGDEDEITVRTDVPLPFTYKRVK